MSSAARALQKAMFAALSGDAELMALLGANRIHDRPPPNAEYPFISFGRSSGFDWSTGTEIGTEHLMTLHVWSKSSSRAEAHAIMDRAEAILLHSPLTLEGHALVSLTQEYSEARSDPDLAVFHGLMRMRALTEPVA